MHKSKKKCNFVCILKIMCNFAKSFRGVLMCFLEIDARTDCPRGFVTNPKLLYLTERRHSVVKIRQNNKKF